MIEQIELKFNINFMQKIYFKINIINKYGVLL